MTCAERGKRGYRTEKAAKHELRKMRRNCIDWERLRAYYCEHHRRWHVGNVPFSRDARRVLATGLVLAAVALRCALIVGLLALVGCGDVNPSAPSPSPRAVREHCDEVDDQGRCRFTIDDPAPETPKPDCGDAPPTYPEALASCTPRH